MIKQSYSLMGWKSPLRFFQIKEMKYFSIILFIQLGFGLVENSGDSNGIGLVLHDNFENFPGVHWQGDVDFYSVTYRDDQPVLQQTGGPGTGSNKLARESNVLFGSWDFSVHFDGFSTSNQNRSFVWITSDSPALQNGIAVRIGENGSQKYIRLLDYTGSGNPIEIVRSHESMPDNVSTVFIRVRHEPDGTWYLGTKYDTVSEYNWVNQSYTIPSSYVGVYFAYQSVYTATRADKFQFGPVTIRKFPLFVRSIEINSSTTLTAFLSEKLPPEMAGDLRLAIDGYNGGITQVVSGNAINIQLNRALSGGIWTIRFLGLRDPIFGNNEIDIVLEFEIFDVASLFDVVINEFTPRPSPDVPQRFIELYNRSHKFLNLDNWTIGRQNQSAKIISPIGSDLILPPGGLAVIGPNVQATLNQDSVIYINLNIPTLGRTTDSIWLRSSDATLVDSVRYDNSWSGILNDGLSVERINPDYASMDRANWLSNPSSFTPGQPNFHFNPITLSTSIKSVFYDEGNVCIIFNQFVRLTEDARFNVDGRSPNSIKYSVWTGNQVRLTPASLDWLNQRSSNVEITNLLTYDGKSGLTFFEEIAHPADDGSLEINEIMYQPLQNRYASFGDQSEYVEIKNRKSYKVTLKDIIISDTIDKHGVFRTWEPEFPEQWQVEANGYAVIFPDTAHVWGNMRLPSFYGVEENTSWARVSRSTLGLTSSGRGVYLRDKHTGALDSVYYSPDWHHPLLRDSRGISLERVESNIESMSPKWTSSADYLGGTPGRVNSAWLQVGGEESESGLSIDPNPFSPDNDGHEDYTRIKLTMSHPGSAIRIRIFDRYGRLVRNLTNDTIIGNAFEVYWNGFDDKNHVLQTGVYIVHVEVFHTEIKNEINFKKALVLVRKK
jgi:hypothetical protein